MESEEQINELKAEINKLKTEINELLSDYDCPVSAQMLEQEEHLVNSSPLLAPLHNQSYHLFDLNKGVFTSTHSIHEKKLLKPGIYAQQPLNSDELIELTHPDDKIFSLKFEKAAIQFLLQLPLDRAKEFSIGYTIRLKTKAGKFECFGISYKVVVCNKAGKPWLLLMHGKYCPLIQLNKSNPYRIVSIEPYDLVKKSKLFSTKEFTYLTNREKEVITEVNNGYQKKEIAEILDASPNTIKTHFKHIFDKCGFSHIHQACLHIIRTGILPLIISSYLLLVDDLLAMDVLFSW
jgi:DNA-binding CsgD family transcriptional regulator